MKAGTNLHPLKFYKPDSKHPPALFYLTFDSMWEVKEKAYRPINQLIIDLFSQSC